MHIVAATKVLNFQSFFKDSTVKRSRCAPCTLFAPKLFPIDTASFASKKETTSATYQRSMSARLSGCDLAGGPNVGSANLTNGCYFYELRRGEWCQRLLIALPCYLTCCNRISGNHGRTKGSDPSPWKESAEPFLAIHQRD